MKFEVSFFEQRYNNSTLGGYLIKDDINNDETKAAFFITEKHTLISLSNWI